MMGLDVEVEIGVSRLAVHFVSQRAIRSSVNIQVQEWEDPTESIERKTVLLKKASFSEVCQQVRP
jgi:hypothetical protein